MQHPTTVMELIRELTFMNPNRRVFVKHPALGDDVTIKQIKAVEIDLDETDEDDPSGVSVEKVVLIECDT